MSKPKFWFPWTYILEGRELPSKQTKCDSSERYEESRESTRSRGTRVLAGGALGVRGGCPVEKSSQRATSGWTRSQEAAGFSEGRLGGRAPKGQGRACPAFEGEAGRESERSPVTYIKRRTE